MSDLTALGTELRDARQARDLTLLEVERRIHIRVKFLEALEQGSLAALPSTAQARGFLRNYARFLNFDPDAMVSRWDQAVLGSTRRRGRGGTPLPDALQMTQVTRAYRSSDAPAEGGRRVFRPVLLLFALLIAAILVGLGVIALNYSQTAGLDSAGNPILSPAALSQSPLATPEIDLTALLTPTDMPIPKPSPLPNPNAPLVTGEVTVKLEVVARTWLRVTVDGAVTYLGAPGPNTMLQYRGRAINIRAANAAGIHAFVNEVDLGLLGARGQVYDQTFTLENMPQPTPLPQMPAPVTPGGA